MYYAEIDENGRCFHVTNDKLPVCDTIIEVESVDVLGKIWNGETWEDEIIPEPEPTPEPQPTQLDRIEAAVTARNDEISQAAIDNYTLELMEGGLL